MQKKVVNNIALAATVLLVPGGFILGTVLAARYYRKARAGRQAATESTEDAADAPEDGSA